MIFLTNAGGVGILCSVRWALEGKEIKDMFESWLLKFFEKISTNNFTLSDAEDLNRGSMLDIP